MNKAVQLCSSGVFVLASALLAVADTPITDPIDDPQSMYECDEETAEYGSSTDDVDLAYHLIVSAALEPIVCLDCDFVTATITRGCPPCQEL